MSYKPKVLTVSDGGTGDASLTAYAVLCGGTTGTGNFQSIASVGSSSEVLTSNGAGSLPTFQAASGAGAPTFVFAINTSNGVLTLGDNATNYQSEGSLNINTFTATNGGTKYYIPFTGTLTRVVGRITTNTLGSGETVDLVIKLNGGTETIISSFSLNASPVNFSNYAMTVAVSAGDYVEIVLNNPAYVTNPQGVQLNCTAYLEG